MKKILLLLSIASLLLSGCAGGRAATKPVSPYSSYSCEKLFKAMEYKISEAKVLYTNREDEDSITKVGGGALGIAAGSALASTLILTPLGWMLAGGLMIGGAGSIIDGMDHNELSDSERIKISQYNAEYNEMKEMALEKKCDYYSMPLWDI